MGDYCEECGEVLDLFDEDDADDSWCRYCAAKSDADDAWIDEHKLGADAW